MPIVLEPNAVFEDIKDAIKADEKGRVLLGRDFAGKNYRVAMSANGEILLTPIVAIPERDLWLIRTRKPWRCSSKGWRKPPQAT